MNLSIVIPVFKSENTLEVIYARLQQVLNKVANSWEIIFVNDGSPDKSWKKIEQLTSSQPNIHAINLIRNFGQHNALLAGIRQARYETIITLDDDLQNPPEDIHKLVSKLREGYDLVYGVPHKKYHSTLRNLASTATRCALSSIMGASSARHVTSFRAFKKSLVSSFENYHGDFVSIDALLSWATNQVSHTSVVHSERSQGASNYSIKKLISYALSMMTSYSSLPLRAASLIGFVCTTFGIGVLIFVVGRYLIEGGSVPGFPFLASIIALFSGAQLFCLGIIGEYLGRIHFRTMGKPSYIIENTIRSKTKFCTTLEQSS